MGLWSGYLLVALSGSAFILAGIALFAPYWYMEEPQTHIGLFATCKWRAGRTRCTWSHEGLIQWTRRQPTWWHVCQTLMATAVVTLIFNLFINIHIAKRQTYYISRVLILLNGFLMLCAFVEILATIAHFGRWAHAEREVMVDRFAYRNFGWAYLLACFSCILQALVIIFYGVHLMKLRKWMKKDLDYKQSMAAQVGSGGYYPPYHQFQYK